MINKARSAAAAAIFCSAALACGSALAGDNAPLQVRAVAFTPTKAPASELEMSSAYTTSSAVLTLADGSTRHFPLSYRILHRSGDYIDGAYAGLIVDHAGRAILESPPDGKGNRARGPFLAAGADGSSLLAIPGARVDGVKGRTLFLINHLEYATQAANVDPGKPPVDLYGLLPMAMNLTVLDQGPVSGRLAPVKLANVDFSSVEGLWIPCNGSTTPWLSHLGSEEYEPDARVFEQKPLAAMNLYRGTPGRLAGEGGANPYRYGHIVEVFVRPDGSTRVDKHYAMGRLSFELGEVMADGRTVYFGDDGDDVIRAMYVADRANDLSAGTLYAAKWVQEDAANFGRARLQWIRLGHASDAEVKALVDGGIRFSDIWEVASPEAVKADPARFSEFRPLQVYTGSGSKSALAYYRLKPGQELAAAFLETRRYAAWLGATTEFSKMEGIAHSVAERKQWTAMSYVRAGMIDGRNGTRPQDDIRLSGDERDLSCGVVYESRLRGGQTDSSGAPIESDFVAVDMVGRVWGERQPAGATVGKFDQCNTERIANPDNLRYSEAMRTLFIGEDSAKHLNNFLWAYSVDTQALVRIFSAPAGGENTGLNVYDDINGHAYLTANVQHPGAAEDLGQYPDSIKVELRRRIDPRGMVGYIDGLPAMTR